MVVRLPHQTPKSSQKMTVSACDDFENGLKQNTDVQCTPLPVRRKLPPHLRTKPLFHSSLFTLHYYFAPGNRRTKWKPSFSPKTIRASFAPIAVRPSSRSDTAHETTVPSAFGHCTSTKIPETAPATATGLWSR